MRALIVVTFAALSLVACRNNDQADNTTNVDENLSTENIVSNDVTAIDAVTGDAANMIAVIRLFRGAAARSLRQAGAKGNGRGVVFSLDGGEAWASWYGVDAPVRLGPRDQVVHMMEDFIKQVELGKKFERTNEDRLTP